MLIQSKGQGAASRRLFLKQTAALSTLGAAAPMALNLAAVGSAAAQTASDYRALVCLFFFGGNDAFNMVLPTDSASWNAYTTVRNQAPESIALLAPGTAPDVAGGIGLPQRLGGVLPITPANAQGRSFALHPLLDELRTMFNTERRLAIVSNVGPLILPTTKAQYNAASHPKPRNLFSHNDQQNVWQSFRTEGATVGWGGRIADVMASQNQRAVFSAISASGNAVWLSGRNVRQYQVGGNGAVRMGGDSSNRTFGSTAVTEAMDRIVRSTRGSHLLERDLAAVQGRSIDAEVALRNALKPASDAAFGTAPASGTYNANNDPKLRYVPDPLVPGTTAFNPVAQQLQIVARMIEAAGNSNIGARRQVFFVSMGGFDTHDAQNRNQADLMARLDHALRYFDTTLGALGLRNNVTTFTASDFGRTFTSNGDGTDHGWGSHHFVMGGAVRGGDLYGPFPTLGLKNTNNNFFDSSPDQVNNGSLLPTTSVDQFGATLARWFGVPDSGLNDIFPNLANFSQRNLGFMSA
jgi:uncharacterized protein (DUF1501 family)